jgi:hypothetical protein
MRNDFLESTLNLVNGVSFKNPDVYIFHPFCNNTKNFNHIAPEMSVRYTISGLNINKFQKVYGLVGIHKTINAGR